MQGRSALALESIPADRTASPSRDPGENFTFYHLTTLIFVKEIRDEKGLFYLRDRGKTLYVTHVSLSSVCLNIQNIHIHAHTSQLSERMTACFHIVHLKKRSCIGATAEKISS